MAEKKVIAHVMHEYELDTARQRLRHPEVTPSYVLGEIDDSEIPGLEQEGLIIQVLGDAPREETAPVVRGGWRVERLDAALPGRGPAPDATVSEEEIDETGPNFYLVRLAGPLLEPWRQELERLGVQLLEHVPPTSYTARLEPGEAHAVSGLSFVSGVRLYGVDDTGPMLLREASPALDAAGPRRSLSMQSFDIRLHRAEDRAAVEHWLTESHVAIAGSGERKIRIYATEGSPLLDEIGALPEVLLVEEYVEPKLFNDVARVQLGVETQNGGSSRAVLFQGEGELVAVADTGLDHEHPDFAGRVQETVALGRANDSSDPHGHGTHVAGSVLGDGSASDGQLAGVAPMARLYFQSLLDAQGRLGGLPVDLGELFRQAYDAGARIHNNSWGAATESAYTLNSEDVDAFVATHRDMLIVIAAGNEGQAARRLHSPPSFPDWLSIGAPATAKNALTVGASRSARAEGAVPGLTWRKGWPSVFPDPPLGNEPVSGNAECLAAFSSRGPCDDRRIKPDLVAPGTDIASTKSSLAPLRGFWGPYPGAGGRYAFLGGTSMAAPLVSGCAALVREYYREEHQHQPSAALLKATLINGTRWLSGPDAIVDQDAAPNYNQGFGAVDLGSTLPSAAWPALRLAFVDSWQDPQHQFASSGQRFRFRLTVASDEPLRLCLAYTDLPARGLQNDLDLVVQEPGGQKHIGNEHLPERLTPLDRGNNVEIVRIEQPAAGEYLIQVSAFNLLEKGQDFAVVVTGALGSGLLPGG